MWIFDSRPMKVNKKKRTNKKQSTGKRNLQLNEDEAFKLDYKHGHKDADSDTEKWVEMLSDR